MSPTERKVCLYASACLELALLEYLIPKPLPFMKIGLANLPIVLALTVFGWKDFLLLVLLKTIGSGLIAGTLFSQIFLITIGGGFASALVMKGTKDLFGERISTLGSSVLGALASNITQLAVAALLVYGKSIFLAAPLVLGVGLVGGIVLGLLAGQYGKKGKLSTMDCSGDATWKSPSHPVLFSLLLADIVLLLLSTSLTALLVSALFLFVAQWGAGRKIRPLPSLLLVLSLCFFSLFEPSGKVLFSLGTLSVTEEALHVALVKGVRLVALVAASQAMVAFPPSYGGKFFDMLRTTLGYFSSYRLEKGGKNLTENIDLTLQSLLHVGENREKVPVKTTVTLLFSLSALCCLLFSVTTPLFSYITRA